MLFCSPAARAPRSHLHFSAAPIDHSHVVTASSCRVKRGPSLASSTVCLRPPNPQPDDTLVARTFPVGDGLAVHLGRRETQRLPAEPGGVAKVPSKAARCHRRDGREAAGKAIGRPALIFGRLPFSGTPLDRTTSGRRKERAIQTYIRLVSSHLYVRLT